MPVMPSYTTSSNNSIALGTELGSGAEGDVFEVSGRAGSVAKIYKAVFRTAEQEEKLRAMLAAPPEDGTRDFSTPHTSIAWPTDILYERGRLAGFLMPRIEQSSKIFELYNPQVRESMYPGFDWRYLHRTARNLATAVNALHAAGCVIGDVNQKNVLVTGRALVTLIDTDSFQVRAPGGRVYRCKVGVADYTPPELLGVSLKDVDREPANDHFGLAVMIFQLLMEGYHPFSGSQRDPSISVYEGAVYLHCIREGIFPYAQNKDFNPPSGSPDFKALPPALQGLFLRCFVQGHSTPRARPTAHDWVDALTAAENSLVQCRMQPTHWYSSHYGSCHWCARDKAGNVTAPRVSVPSQPRRVPLQVPVRPRSTSPTPAPHNVSRAVGLVAAAVLGLVFLAGGLMFLLSRFAGGPDNTQVQNPTTVAGNNLRGSGGGAATVRPNTQPSQRNSAAGPVGGAASPTDEATTAGGAPQAGPRGSSITVPRPSDDQPPATAAAPGGAVTPAQPPPPAPGVLAADYLRRADQLFQQENFDAAYATANEGLQVDPSNSGLQSLKQRIEAARRLLARRSSMPSVTAGELPAAAADGRAAESPQERNRKAAIRSKPSLVARVSGTVWVDVTVDTQGNVVRAQAVSGPPELKQAAVDAARQSKFRPATREGVPVSDRLTLPYMFSARN